MKDMLEVGKDIYFIDAKGAWLDKRIKEPFLEFAKEAKRKKSHSTFF